ncbi:MAG TPA: hypothetical protein PL172_14925 [Thermomicrobiales bacterium]|nr:hypothetical protein [Thermomicrobiales bacterium]
MAVRSATQLNQVPGQRAESAGKFGRCAELVEAGFSALLQVDPS